MTLGFDFLLDGPVWVGMDKVARHVATPVGLVVLAVVYKSWFQPPQPPRPPRKPAPKKLPPRGAWVLPLAEPDCADLWGQLPPDFYVFFFIGLAVWVFTRAEPLYQPGWATLIGTSLVGSCLINWTYMTEQTWSLVFASLNLAWVLWKERLPRGDPVGWLALAALVWPPLVGVVSFYDPLLGGYLAEVGGTVFVGTGCVLLGRRGCPPGWILLLASAVPLLVLWVSF